MYVEEVPDEEPQVRGGVLEEGAGAILKISEEYHSTLKWGQEDTPVPTNINIKCAQRKQPRAQNTKDKVLSINKSDRAMRGSSTNKSIKKLWDRPILQQSFEWQHDPQMPREWNKMVSAMKEADMARQTQVERVFRIVEPEEIS